MIRDIIKLILIYLLLSSCSEKKQDKAVKSTIDEQQIDCQEWVGYRFGDFSDHYKIIEYIAYDDYTCSYEFLITLNDSVNVFVEFKYCLNMLDKDSNLLSIERLSDSIIYGFSVFQNHKIVCVGGVTDRQVGDTY